MNRTVVNIEACSKSEAIAALEMALDAIKNDGLPGDGVMRVEVENEGDICHE